MRIAKINSVISNYEMTRNLKTQNDENKNISQGYTTPIMNSYQDFNVNFRGRTPENFYAQEYNVKYMPNEMKKYLAVDYENRKHIPPEQVMGEVFKFIPMADNVEDVKELYPDEELFANLHEASLKGRTGILSDIRLAREIEKAPLFNDNSDDLGVYLLKKIYMEGKTIREINKDFYEKDLNKAYRGVITQPINYGTTSAYGIRYPKQDFWNSFIATRDEYREFFIANLPKTSKEVSKTNTGHSTASRFVSNSKNETEKAPAKRKFNLKTYRKKDLKDDIKAGKADKGAIEKAVRKRFTKNDPEASFIVKYLSPIMTVAADRIHLSEEEKAFAEADKAKNTNGEFMFSRFWKANPELLEHYSTAITDTIELFEEAYGAGGNISINNEYETITKKSENQKPIDFVSEEFKRLLDYTQTIVPNRTARYQEHDRQQEEWEKHFLSRYGEIKEEINPAEVEHVNAKESIESIAKGYNGASVYTLKGTDNNDIKIVGNLDEALKEYIFTANDGLPSQFRELIYRHTIKHPLTDDKLKLSIAVLKHRDKIDDDSIYSLDKTQQLLNDIRADFYQKYAQESFCANMSTGELLATNYLKPLEAYDGMFFGKTKQFRKKVEGIVCTDEEAKKMNEIYARLHKPISTSEAQKIANAMTEWVSHFDENEEARMDSAFSTETVINQFISYLRAEIKNDKNARKIFKGILVKATTPQQASRAVLSNDKNDSKELIEARLYTTINVVLRNFLNNFSFESKKLTDEEIVFMMKVLRRLKQEEARLRF